MNQFRKNTFQRSADFISDFLAFEKKNLKYSKLFWFKMKKNQSFSTSQDFYEKI
jgi:hypothetical protein